MNADERDHQTGARIRAGLRSLSVPAPDEELIHRITARAGTKLRRRRGLAAGASSLVVAGALIGSVMVGQHLGQANRAGTIGPAAPAAASESATSSAAGVATGNTGGTAGTPAGSAKSSSEMGSTEKGSTEKGSTEKGSTEKGSTEKGTTEKGSRTPAGTPTGSSASVAGKAAHSKEMVAIPALSVRMLPHDGQLGELRYYDTAGFASQVAQHAACNYCGYIPGTWGVGDSERQTAGVAGWAYRAPGPNGTTIGKAIDPPDAEYTITEFASSASAAKEVAAAFNPGSGRPFHGSVTRVSWPDVDTKTHWLVHLTFTPDGREYSVAIQVSDSYVVAAKVFDAHGEKIADQLAIKWVHDMTANLTSDGLVK